MQIATPGLGHDWKAPSDRLRGPRTPGGLGGVRLEGFQRGVTTRKQALEILGPPARTSTDAQDGSTTCSWDYVHVDAQGSTAILTTLKFGPDDRLQIKMVNQSSHVRGSGRPPS